MSYRDDREAALGRLVALEQELASRRLTHLALSRWRADLRDEIQRLQHALVWYRNGEARGWHLPGAVDDLGPAPRPTVRLPGAAQLARVHGRLDQPALCQRAVEIEHILATSDWRIEPLRAEIASLRALAASLRDEVEPYAARHPGHPPPPRLIVGATLAVGICLSLGGLWMAMVLVTILLS